MADAYTFSTDSSIPPMLKRRGLMLVLASPPGGGKTTVSREIAATDPQAVISVSATTRGRRPGEEEGKHYYFVSPEKFQDMVEGGQMLEHALVYNSHYYGTPRAPVETALHAGKDVLFDIDWQGNRKLREVAPDDVVSVFLLPPTWKDLETRLHGRARDTEAEIIRRLGKAQDEIAHYGEFHYVVVNNDLADTVTAVRSILNAERHKRRRLTALGDFVSTLRP
jgi:guanylate kinase